MTELAKATPRSILAQKREAALAKTRSIALPVPNYDGIVVKYRAITIDEVRKANDSVSKLPKVMQALEANARILANACLGIYIKNDDGLYESVLGAEERVPTFEYDLAVQLVDPSELPAENKLTAAQIVKLLYVTDLDVMSAGDALANASGTRQIEAEEDFLEA